MPFTLSYPRANQRLYSFKSVQLLEGAKIFAGLTAVDIGVEIEGRDILYGNGTTGYGRPRGQLKVDFMMKFAADAFYKFGRDNPQFLDNEYTYSFVQEEGSSRDVVDVIQLTLDGLKISTSGTNADEIEIPGTAITALLNGEPLMAGDALGQLGLAVF